MIDLSGTFDTTNALSSMFLWMIFGWMSVMLNCDLQRFMQNNVIIMHFFGIIAFIFLFTLLDSNNKTSLRLIIVKSIFIYFLFVLMTKTKWYFILPVLTLLLFDQLVKKDIAFNKSAGNDTTKQEEIQKVLSRVINVIIIVLIVIGNLHYMYLQYSEYGNDFNIFTFFFGIPKCKPYDGKSNFN